MASDSGGPVSALSRRASSSNTAPDWDAIIFDLDGVIVDSEIWWDEVRRDFAGSHGRPWTVDDRASVMGRNSRQWSETMRARLLLELTPAEIERAIVEAMVDRYRAEGAPEIEGAAAAVERLARSYPLGLASSAHRDVIDASLRATGLDRVFQVVVSSDDVAHGKPEPDVYLETARRLGVDPSRCLVIEDSLNGVLAGRAAGMAVALVPNLAVPPAAGAHEAATIVLERLDMIDPVAIAALAAVAWVPGPQQGRDPGQ